MNELEEDVAWFLHELLLDEVRHAPADYSAEKIVNRAHCPYEALPEEDKNYYRDQAKRIIETFHIGEW